MSSHRPRVLFISHSASRNGATILLLSFLRWLRPRVDWHIEVLMNGRGALLDDFRELARTTVWRDPEPVLNALLPRALQRGVMAACAGMAFPRGEFDLVYANTAATAPLVARLGGRARRLLWHVHELPYALDSILKQPDHLQRFRGATRYVAVSSAVQECLHSVHGIDPSRIDLVHGFVDKRPAVDETEGLRRARVRAQLGLPAQAFVVGACGSLGWRKGSDVFLQIAQHLVREAPGREITFLWVGGEPGEPAALAFEHDARLLGLGGRCRLVPSTANVLECYAAMDIFALTSREDPFPLVVLEAADRGLPVVCFEDGGGAVEFVADDAGCRVPYLDLAGFADMLARLAADPVLAARLGACGQARVERSHRLERQAPQLLAALQRCLGGEEAATPSFPSASRLQPAATHDRR